MVCILRSNNVATGYKNCYTCTYIIIGTKDIDYTVNNAGVQFVPLDPTGTTLITFRPDNFALESDETIVLDLGLTSVNINSFTTSDFDPSLPNVFFQSRTVLSIQDSTGKLAFLQHII